ncbi:hypothetical protein RR42_s0707 [Cupriavidus basilensis]|uniref:Uncharacterized protein n=1 Tax=Cupriavidus basilensis TaxID=68895 RepID=A0A0C4YH45_9BURK|nr:hypothetical protein RR42_s0707 [Cupriavidus basilensis]
MSYFSIAENALHAFQSVGDSPAHPPAAAGNTASRPNE